MFEHLLQTPENEELLNRFIKQLKEERNFQFIGAYFNTQREIASFIMSLNHQWPEFFGSILNGQFLSNKQIRMYSVYTLYFSNEDDIHGVNAEKYLSHYISTSNDYLSLNEPNVEKINSWFYKIGCCFY